jgi:FAD/FMN-containing dehydrogenase
MELAGALEKNNTGVDLRQLFIGSEGVLGVITEATLKLARVPTKLDVFLFAVKDLAAVLRLFRWVREQNVTLMAYEFFTDRCLARLLRHRQLKEPFAERHSHYVLIEIERLTTDVDALIEDVLAADLVEDGVLAQSSQQAGELWALREGISESLSATGLPHKNDIALPVKALEGFCGELDAVFARQYPGFEICVFGHIGDGNLHVNVMKPDAMEKAEFLTLTKAADKDMFALVQKYEGSVSAEHGIGLLKKDALPYTRPADQVELMRAMKRVLDPKGILNPGKIFDP